MVVVIEKEWLSIAEIADKLGLAENTARRYSHLFNDFLQDQKFGRTTKYTAEAIEVISRIAGLYNQGFSTEEIKRKLQDDMPQVVDVVVTKQEQSAGLSSYELLKKVVEEQGKQKEQQEAFNKALLERLDRQTEYIEQSLKKRDEQLMQVLRENQETKKMIAAASQKKRSWLHRWFQKGE